MKWSHQFRSVAQLCPTLCDPTDCSTPGFPVLHYLPEFAQTRVHWVGDATQPFHHLSPPYPLSSIFPSIRVFSVSWLFASGGQCIKALDLASVLPVNIQSWFPLELIGLISFLSKGISRVFYSTTVWKHQLFSLLSSLWSNSHIHTWLLQRLQPWIYGPLSTEWYLCFLIYCLGLS